MKKLTLKYIKETRILESLNKKGFLSKTGKNELRKRAKKILGDKYNLKLIK